MAITILKRTVFGPNTSRSGLVMHIDPANTKSYPGTGTLVTDLSGNSYNGTLVNGVSYSSGAFTFDGADDYVSWSSPSSRWSWTPSGSGLNTMTIDVWVKTTDSSGYVISKPWNGNGEYNYWIYQGNTWYVSSGGSSAAQSFTAYTTGLWENITCIVTPTQIATYRNGSLNAAFTNHNLTGNTPSFGNNSIPLSYMTLYPYGTSFNIPSHAVAGDASVLRIYNRALTADEVLTNYRSTKARFGA